MSYIKPQRNIQFLYIEFGCISFMSYIKPQLNDCSIIAFIGCISFMSYIKPQLWLVAPVYICVVYLLCPTSNHNFPFISTWRRVVVYLLCPTSNHN